MTGCAHPIASQREIREGEREAEKKSEREKEGERKKEGERERSRTYI
jgi:hypothetical protein